jgi:stress response protein YsnF
MKPTIPAQSDPSLRVVEEHASITKTIEETGAVRVRVQTGHVQQACDLQIATQEVDVQRVAKNLFVDERRAPWSEDGVIVVPIYEEVLVRRLMLKEEIRLVPRESFEREPTTVSLRRDHVVVERRQPDGSWLRVDSPETADGTGGQDPNLDPPSNRSEP